MIEFLFLCYIFYGLIYTGKSYEFSNNDRQTEHKVIDVSLMVILWPMLKAYNEKGKE